MPQRMTTQLAQDGAGVPSSLEGCDPHAALKGAREFLKTVEFELADPQPSPYIISWSTLPPSNFESQVLYRVQGLQRGHFVSQAAATTPPLQYIVCIECDGPLGFRLIRKRGFWSVVEVLPRSQAQLSGVDIGDTVVSINGLDVPSSLKESHPASYH